MPPFADLPIGTGTIEVTRLDGSTARFEEVRYDANRMENGFLVMETHHRWNPRVYHVANVSHWEVIY